MIKLNIAQVSRVFAISVASAVALLTLALVIAL